MKRLKDKELKELIQSGHINVLIGSGCSLPYLQTLNDIETLMNSDDPEDKEKARKQYYEIIRKAKSAVDESRETKQADLKKLKKTKANYDSFISFWTKALSKRSLSIINKQVNIFTTNFDSFIVDSFERTKTHYNDCFSSRIRPMLSVTNYNKIQRYKSLQFDNTSDIQLFNSIKFHGSITWEQDKDKKEIIYSSGDHIDDDLDEKSGDEFNTLYEQQLALINPTAEKHYETVLDINYASMLRKFALELEKENSLLLIFGFSLQDGHIRDLLESVMKTNPTLVVVFFSYSHYDTENDYLNESLHPNLYIVSPGENCKQPFDEATNYVSSVVFGKSNSEEDDNAESKPK